MSTGQHAASTGDALPLAGPRDIREAASVISHAFGWERMTGSIWRPKPSWKERLRTALTMPMTLLTALLAVNGRQLYYRPGVTFSIDSLSPRRYLVYARNALIGLALLLTVFLVASLRSLQFAVTVNDVMTDVLKLLGGVLIVGLLAMRWSHASNRREIKKKGYTKSKKPRSGATFPPPKPPTWRAGNLATDPRKKQSGAFDQAMHTLDTVVPSGEVVEGTAASPAHVRAYKAAGFVQWHEKSLAMWKLMP